MFNGIITAVMALMFQLYVLTGNLGLAIIGLTLLVRVLLLPLSRNALKSQESIRKLQPELTKLKKEYKSDKVQLQQAQMALYKKYNINPVAGCLPYLVQIGLFIILYRVLVQFLQMSEMNGVQISPDFLWLNLSQPDSLHILPILAGLSQLFLSLMISPGAELPDLVPNKSKQKAVQEQNKQEEDFAEMAQTMQKQMLFFMPVMTAIIAWSFPSGLALYWIITTTFSIVQQYTVSGWGGLVSYWQLAKSKLSRN